MQQRSSSSSSRCSSDEHKAINIGAEQQQHAKRRRNPNEDLLDVLPIYHHRTVTGQREISRSRSLVTKKCIHAIPVLVLLCLLTLWWFSFPVDVEIMDGRITAIRQIQTSSRPNNNTRIDLTILATVAASSPIPAFLQDLSGEDETYLEPVSSPN
ncbi:hypothetical protein RJT34_29961 [Clitoria ternatea]|uniref:Transmembrane protein n=1 Tax=Clitoria ternatea TaxID=43366 RepID=A0AAN9I278_CLITE